METQIMVARSPQDGLKILENLYARFPHNRTIFHHLVNTYIRYNNIEKALDLIDTIPMSRTDAQSLKLIAWKMKTLDLKDVEKSMWENIIDKQYFLQVEKMDNTLVLTKSPNESITDKDIVLFCNVYNESLRLPFFLKYYRKLGVTKFVIVDNNSNDGSSVILNSQEDCYIYWTNESYSEAGSGNAWINQLMTRHALDNQWCLYVDVDEFLVFPHCEKLSLKNLVEYMEVNNEEVMASYLLDIFPNNLKDLSDITPFDNLIKSSPYFYNNYNFLQTPTSPYQFPIGGFYTLFNHIVKLVKTGLFQYKPGTYFLSSSHEITPLKVSNITSTYLHCKFIGDFENRSLTDLKRKQYAAGGRNYTFYKKIFEETYLQNDFKFSELDKSVKYENSHQLIDLGLIKSTDGWKNYVDKYRIR